MPPAPTPRDATASPTLVLGALFAASAVLGFWVLPRVFATRSPLVGKPAPDFSLAIVHGGDQDARLRLADLRGRPVLLDFWATWCGPCQLEAPLLDRLHRRAEKSGLVVVGVDTGDKASAAQRFAEQKNLSYPIVYDDGDRVQALYEVTSLPTLVLVGRDGVVVEVESGYTSESALDELVARAR